MNTVVDRLLGSSCFAKLTRWVPIHPIHFVPGASYTLSVFLGLTQGARRATEVSPKNSSRPSSLGRIRTLLWRLWLGSADPQLLRVQNADFVKAEPHSPVPVVDLLQAHRFAFQRVSDKDILPRPAHLAATRYPARVPVGRILYRPRPARIGSVRSSIMADRRLLSQSFMRALLVVLLAKLVETRLLRAPIAGRRLSRFLFQRPMHPLMAPVLLRLAGLDVFGRDPQFDQPYG